MSEPIMRRKVAKAPCPDCGADIGILFEAPNTLVFDHPEPLCGRAEAADTDLWFAALEMHRIVKIDPPFA